LTASEIAAELFLSLQITPNQGDVASTFRADNEHTPEDDPLGLEVQGNG